MKIAICGAGMTGAYAYRYLYNAGFDNIVIFGKECHSRCGISPCAWGTSNGFEELVRAAGLNPKDYILRALDHVWIDEIKIKAELMTFDKPRLIADLLHGVTVHYSKPDINKFDRVIDATGISRAYLPEIENDINLPCIQYRVHNPNPNQLDNRIKLGGIGYAWCFPLLNNEFHIGAGSLRVQPREVLQKMDQGQSFYYHKENKIICGCTSKIRLTSPFDSLPFVNNGKIWGVGEAIGCVAPLAGDGIVPGMKSVQILAKYWDDPYKYTDAILEEFSWMKKERSVIDKLRYGKALNFRDGWVLKKNSERMGMDINFKDALRLLWRLR